MARVDLIQLDDGATGAPRVSGPRTDTSQVTETDINAAVAQAGIDLKVDPVTLAYEAGNTDTPVRINKFTPEELKAYQQGRADKATQIRKFGTADNPQPYEAPVGANWNLYGGVWKLYYKGYYIGNKDGFDQSIIDKINTSGNGNNNNGNGNGGNGNGAVIKYDANGNPIVTDVNPISADTRDAFATLQNLFTSYGLGSLASEIAGYMTSGLTASEALIKLKTNPSGAYAERFAGNFARTKKGLNVISEAAYIDLENSYAETLKAYGLGNMLSTDSKQNAKQFASYIENDISAVEFKDRINTVQERVVNADPAIKAMFKEFYPSLTNSDLVSYFLNPTETIGKLKEKVTSAEIGAAFTGQGLTTSLTSASDLARYGIDRAGALEGAANIAGVLPEATKLGNIYGETGITYNQQTGEQEFLKSSDEAKRKRNLLASKERASFNASAGNAPGAYSTGYLKKSSAAGLI